MQIGFESNKVQIIRLQTINSLLRFKRLQIAIFKNSTFKIAGIEYGFGKVGLRKIDRNHLTIIEGSILELQLIKRGQVHRAIMEIEGQ